ncbi:hypothetical protein CN514_00760 [Bacillus sp. AFS001701]|uniref:hypothetical protein n=1 Tax=Bacillus sp. AFS001701 TaxID=2033480 RepID=UPI000BF45630|nr:hypothetical protein [Bacillus sp. AFS001701]PET77561.1 hypothetical protein CN514_00760 [Bacillus sp. AFS001701]
MKEKIKKPFYKKWWVWLIAVILFIGFVNSFNDTDTASTKPKEEVKKETVKKEQPKKETPKAAAPKKVKKVDNSIKSGMYKVGNDIQPGEYVLISNGTGYFQVSKDSSGTLESIVSNDNFTTDAIVSVKAGQYFEFKDAKAYPIAKAPKLEPKNGKLGEGTYKVGLHIQPGEYKVVADGMAYVEVSKSSYHGLEDIVTNDNFEGEKYITVKAGQYIKVSSAYIVIK